MKRLGLGLLMSVALAGCAPGALRTQPDALVSVRTSLVGEPAPTRTGTVYRFPGPAALQVTTDRPAYVTTLFLPGDGVGAQVLEQGRQGAGEVRRVPLPSTLGFTQVFTVASLEPLDLRSAQGVRSLNDLGKVVEAAAQGQPRGHYNVSTQVYSVARFGTLQITSNVPGASVDLDGQRVGQTPLTLNVPEGQVELTWQRPGYVTHTQRFTVAPDVVTVVNGQLRLITGTLQVRSAVLADVYVDQRWVGRVQPLPGAAGLFEYQLVPGTAGVNIVPVDRSVKAQTILLRINPFRHTRVTCEVKETYSCKIENL